jgi:hypothetical protein
MGTNKIKITLIIIILLSLYKISIAQAEYVPYNHPVYDFLERMDAEQIITGYNSIERPKNRKQISNYLQQVIEKSNLLSTVDQKILEDYKTEYEFELSGTLNNSESLIGSSDFSFISQKEKYLYSLIKPEKGTLFINMIVDINNIYEKDKQQGKNYFATYVKYGGQIRGTILDRIGFSIKGTNGKVLGDKEAAENINELKFSYKYNLDPSNHSGTDYVDNTEGYLAADFDFLQFKIGRDRKQIGYGPINYLLSDNSPQFDYISFDLEFQPLTFSYFHGKLLGGINYQQDTVQGGIKNISDKYIGYHRIGINVSRDFSFGLGELIIYSNRSIDLGYLNPFNFYKSVEHADQDRDNSLLFVDLMNNSIKGLKLFGSVLIDDIDFGKIGTGWYGNELLYDFTMYSSNLYNILPLDLYIQYIRCEPYVYTHRIHDNSYTNTIYGLADPIQPNSDIITARLNFNPNYRLSLYAEFSYSRHGANELNNDGTIRKNVGGNVLIGHRENDATEVHFLEGDREYYRSLSFGAVYQPIKDYFITGRVDYRKNSLQNNVIQNYLIAYFVIGLRI